MSRSLPVLTDRALASPSQSPSPSPSPRAEPGAERAAPRAARLSIIDRCDLACVYCRPHRRDGEPLRGSSRLDVAAWETLVRGLVLRGVRRIRLTGGEPLVHPRVVEIVRAVARVPGVEDVSLTTNGTRLSLLAGALRDAGLRRLNVSVDTLDAGRFFRLTRGGRLAEVLEGLAAAARAGFEDTKINTVVLAGENEAELVPIVRWAWALGATPRLLELMGVGEAARMNARVVPYAAIRARVAGLLRVDEPVQEPDRGPARYVLSRDGHHRIGFITGASESFCDGCDRLRVSSDGRLLACLASPDALDAAAAIRRGDVEGVAAQLDAAWARKPGGDAWRGCAEASAARVAMRSTGG